MKRCCGCGISKPLDQFYRKHTSKDGRTPRCKKCLSAKQKERLNNPEVRARRNAQTAQWQTSHQVERKTYSKQWYATNVSPAMLRERRQYVAQWVRDNPDRHRANCQRWRKENPERHREHGRRHQANRRALKRARFIEDVDPRVVYDTHNGVCGICHLPIEGDFHVDHIIPLSRGGMHGYDNVQPAHPDCNLRKGARLDAV